MSYVKNHVIESNGTEIDFYKALIAYITGLDSRITCVGDPDEEFDVSTKGSSYKPTFTFKVGNREYFILYRPHTLSENEQCIGTKINLTASSDVTNESIYNANGAVAYDTEAYRNIKVTSIITSNLIHIWFISGNSTPSNKSISLIFSVSGSSGYKAGQKDQSFLANFSTLTFYNTDTEDSGKFVSRFSYSMLPGTIDYIKSSVYYNLNGSSTGDAKEKIFEITGLYDCTTVTTGDTISLKDGLYVAVGTNQLVKIS